MDCALHIAQTSWLEFHPTQASHWLLNEGGPYTCQFATSYTCFFACVTVPILKHSTVQSYLYIQEGSGYHPKMRANKPTTHPHFS